MYNLLITNIFNVLDRGFNLPTHTKQLLQLECTLFLISRGLRIRNQVAAILLQIYPVNAFLC